MPGQLGYYRHPTIAGDLVVFVSEDDLWRVSTEGGAAERLTANPGRMSFPRLSPDGRHVAFTSRDEGHSDVFVMSVDGGPADRLTYFGANSLPVGWTRDGSAVIVSSDWQQPFAGDYHLWTVPLDGGAPVPLNVGPARAMSRAPRGGGRVLGRHSLDPARWKRYRGGRAGQLWIDRTGSGEYAQLGADLNGNLADPMWIGQRVYFISDHEGHGNIYSVTPTGRNIARHTDHGDFFARFAHSDGSRIVYHCGADLWLLDPAADGPEQLDVRIPSARPERSRRFEKPGRFVETVDLHPSGHSLALVARGHAFTSPLWEGAVTRHGEGSADRERLLTWLPDGERVAYMTDAGGEEKIVVRKADGTGDSTVIEGDFGRAREMIAAPAGTDRVAISNHRHELLIVDLSRGTVRKVYEAPFFWLHGIAWSPDGRWLAAGASQNEMTSSIVVTNARSGRSRVITRPEFSDAYPAWDPGGSFLYFVSNRSFNPFYDAHFHDYSFPQAGVVAVVPLERTQRSPFSTAQATPRPPGAPPESANGKDNGKDNGDGPPEVKIDFTGIEDRVVRVPGADARYARVKGAAGKILYLSFPMAGSLSGPNSGPKGKLEAYDFASQKAETVAEGVSGFTVSADGKVIAYLAGRKLRVVPLGFKDDGSKAPDKPGRESGWIDLNRFRLVVEPGDEWGQMLHEAWRLQREYFWRKDMAKVNWNAVLRRYGPLVDRVGTRSEFSDLMWEMQGELGTSHAYELGGDYRPEPRVRQGSLGVDLARTARGVWSVERIPRGDSWTKAASPLAAPGLDIREGDRLVSVDGVTVGRSQTPYAALADRAGQPVTVEVQRGRTRARRVVVEAIGDEFSLRYRDWVNRNRKRVHEATNGRAGYIHIPDMGATGFAEFHRSFLSELEKDGLVVDVRYNRGGNVSQLLLARLLRKRLGYRITRWNPARAFPYESAPGPMVCLTNESSGSDGDIFSHTWKMHGLGPLIGTRTWGGVTGIWPQQALVDGTVTTQPEYGSWFDDVGYEVENYGTDPDIEVVIAPQDWVAGRDPQMESGLAELQRLLDAEEL